MSLAQTKKSSYFSAPPFLDLKEESPIDTKNYKNKKINKSQLKAAIKMHSNVFQIEDLC